MGPERARRLSLVLFVLAGAAAALAASWAVSVDPPPNLDRYDYVGRAWHATQGEGLRPLIVYPLRMVFPGAGSFPPDNLTRPPLWPLALSPVVAAGAGSRAGVWLAAALLAALLYWMRTVGDQAFGGGAGGLAALALAASFTTWRVLLGGGPEIALALLTLIVWSWRPRGGGALAHLACGTLYGLLPLLHPTGWLLAAAALAARGDRYDRRHLGWLVLGAAAAVVPWHLRLWLLSGHPLGLLQSYAELARNLDDPGGLGPYRGLTPQPTWQVMASRSGEVVALGLHRVKMHLLHLNTWIAWPVAALAVYGAAGEWRLALRDALVIAAVAIVLAPFSAEFRPLFPLLPVVCLWAGAGLARLGGRLSSPAALAALAAAAVAAGWFLPPGLASSPLHDLDAWPPAYRKAPAPVVQKLRRAGDPLAAVFTESAHLAWESRREVVFLPRSPQILERLRRMAPLRRATILALGQGRHSKWVDGADWDRLLARCTVIEEHPEGPVLLRLPPLDEVQSPATPEEPRAPESPPERATPPTTRRAEAESLDVATDAPDPSSLDSLGVAAEAPDPSLALVDPRHRLAAGYLPSDLVEIPVPPASRKGLLLRAPAQQALMDMCAAARREGIELRVVSAFRSWQRQQVLYRSAQARHGEHQRWVAPPGASEHQLGTTVDFADAELRQVLEPGFAATEEGRWLAAHAQRWGFRLSYPPDPEDRGLYHPEPWHYRWWPPAMAGANSPDSSAGDLPSPSTRGKREGQPDREEGSR